MEKRELHDFELKVLFGKNESNIYRSVKKDSLDFLKGFPNVEIRYEERLHAKYFQNDFEFIVTSLNLYDYSLANNIEVGIRFRYAAKGIVGAIANGADALINTGIDKVKQDVIGLKKEENPIEKFESIMAHSELKYKTQPTVVEKGGLSKYIGGKKLDGYTVIVDNLSGGPFITKENSIASATIEVEKAKPLSSPAPTPVVTIEKQVETKKEEPVELKSESGKMISASQFAKANGLTAAQVTVAMQKAGLVEGDNITEKGVAAGLVMKSYMGKEYVSYPSDLKIFEDLKKG